MRRATSQGGRAAAIGGADERGREGGCGGRRPNLAAYLCSLRLHCQNMR